MFPFATNQEQGREENVLLCGHEFFSQYLEMRVSALFFHCEEALCVVFKICPQVCHVERRLKQDNNYVTHSR